MHQKKFALFTFLFTILFLSFYFDSYGQMITGVWKGKINKKKTEVKIIQKGDSLLGTSYYYESENNYRRYSIKGYFDTQTNEAVWWDDELIEEKTGKAGIGTPGKVPYLSSADFNCPGSGKMMLDGDAALKNKSGSIQGPVHLEKTNETSFPDEWDFIIENYTSGANDPYYIDSVSSIASTRVIIDEEEVSSSNRNTETVNIDPPPTRKPEPVRTIQQSKPEQKPVTVKKTIEDEFKVRQKIIATEIPVAGDSIELSFYDNAQIDGDSISLFLNNKLIFQHIRLTAVAYTIKLPVSELNETNELVMVAENLGEIPPNTSYMLAIVDDKRYEAMLKSTEESSAVIRLVKPKDQSKAVKN